MYTYIITKTVIEVKLIQNITKITLPWMCIRYVKKAVNFDFMLTGGAYSLFFVSHPEL